MTNEQPQATGILIGYARVSTDDQRLDLQIDALTKAGIERTRIYEEQASGVKTRRPVFAECLRSLRQGDTLVVWRLDRAGRSLIHLIEVMADLEKRGVKFRSLNEAIDTATSTGRLVFNVLGAIAQFERDLISERTKAGLKAARLRGHRGGRKPKVTPQMLKAAKAILADGTVTWPEAAKIIGCSASALHRAFHRANEPRRQRELRKAARRAGKLVAQ